jgi:energy-coupling factor transport system ATP-binding protein
MRVKVHEAAALVHMEDRKHSVPQELSGGQKQRVAIAGVMVNEAAVLLFDEPLANLDPATGKYAIELIDEIHKNTGNTIIIIEHRIEDVLQRRVDRIILLEEGRVICQSPPAELLLSGKLRDAGLREPLYITALRMAGHDLRKNRNIDDISALDASTFKTGLTDWFYAAGATEGGRETEELLRVVNLRQRYANGTEAVKGVSFSIGKGEAVALLGCNGAGKSTLAGVICGMEPASSGKILYKGADIATASIADRAKNIGFVMQDPNHMLSKPMIYDEVALGLRARGVPEAEAKEKVYQILRVCGLYPMRNWPISALSFGQKKRVTVAAVLVLGCELLILDEPTAGQDYAHYTEIMEFLLRLNTDTGITLIFITHDMHLALEYTDRAIVMADGAIIADRPTASVFGDADVIGRASLRRTSLYELAVKSGLPPGPFISKFISGERATRHKTV